MTDPATPRPTAETPEPLTPFHVFRDVEPEALCPKCGFPAWSHDPATAYLWRQRVEADARAAPEPSGLREAATEYRDAEWAMRINHDEKGDHCETMTAHNALVDRWRAADASLCAHLGIRSPFT